MNGTLNISHGNYCKIHVSHIFSWDQAGVYSRCNTCWELAHWRITVEIALLQLICKYTIDYCNISVISQLMRLNKSLPALEVTVYRLHLIIMNCRTTKLKIAPKVLQEYTVNIDFVMQVRWKKESGKAKVYLKRSKNEGKKEATFKTWWLLLLCSWSCHN